MRIGKYPQNATAVAVKAASVAAPRAARKKQEITWEKRKQKMDQLDRDQTNIGTGETKKNMDQGSLKKRFPQYRQCWSSPSIYRWRALYL